jgi:hypothetical protein
MIQAQFIYYLDTKIEDILVGCFRSLKCHIFSNRESINLLYTSGQMVHQIPCKWRLLHFATLSNIIQEVPRNIPPSVNSPLFLTILVQHLHL